jgi:NTP pyrophosphatase (non-canonical NTP hydrolase)
MTTLEQLTLAVVRFRDERDWAQFHTPKNLVAGVAIEAAELLETLQWVEGVEAFKMAQEKRDEIAHEAADVCIYLLLLCHEMKIDLAHAVESKLLLNEERYPVEMAKGRMEKYDKL